MSFGCLTALLDCDCHQRRNRGPRIDPTPENNDVAWESAELRPLISSKAKEAGEDYWIDEKDLQASQARAQAIKNRKVCWISLGSRCVPCFGFVSWIFSFSLNSYCSSLVSCNSNWKVRFQKKNYGKRPWPRTSKTGLVLCLLLFWCWQPWLQSFQSFWRLRLLVFLISRLAHEFMDYKKKKTIHTIIARERASTDVQDFVTASYEAIEQTHSFEIQIPIKVKTNHFKLNNVLIVPLLLMISHTSRVSKVMSCYAPCWASSCWSVSLFARSSHQLRSLYYDCELALPLSEEMWKVSLPF